MTRPLSIVHSENSCGWGGQEIRILTEARGFLDRGHRVTLLTPPEAPIFAAAQRMGIPAVARLLAEHAAGRKNHAMRLWVLLILERWFARYEPDFSL